MQSRYGMTVNGIKAELSQDDNINEMFYREIRDVSRSNAFVLLGDFNFPDIN